MADNMTTALLMGAVVLAVGADNKKFVALSCINIVVAANAGGAYSPFGDITTLMVWQAGDIDFFQFFWLFLPALVNVLVPALLMHFALPKGVPQARGDMVAMKPGARRIIGLFLFTIALTVAGHQVLGMPPVLGMLTGFALLAVFGFHLRRRGQLFDAYSMVAGAEWDTLFFFYGVLLCVGGLAAFGYLSLLSTSLYGDLGATAANVLIGLVSAVIDNIPVMYAVLTMNPPMDVGQWMLVTLTAGVGGSLLSIGSAAGVALMGQARGSYTFFSHLKWSGAVALGYAASIATHLLVNGHLFGVPV
jgi:Na+/H+ antiporter NhaD/arsenite permease-like protein